MGKEREQIIAAVIDKLNKAAAQGEEVTIMDIIKREKIQMPSEAEYEALHSDICFAILTHAGMQIYVKS